MSYLALYRKFRPRTFNEVVGQDHIVKALRNQIKTNRIGHAYLFCGTRGTGKTTLARIFAKAINCENPNDGNPCLECSQCKDIESSRALNVIEIDAASNNGVDNIRQLREEVEFPPADGKYKVYIIDEVHMLSQSAFNALLKTIEEPPEYAIFILATTESYKLPVTIISRCQRYDFRRISLESIKNQVMDLCTMENIQITPDAALFIAKCADGSMRDALSILDQCSAICYGEELDLNKVVNILGVTDLSNYKELLLNIYNNDTLNSINALKQIISRGVELKQFTTDFIWYIRNVMLSISNETNEDMLDTTPEQLDEYKELAKIIPTNTLISYINLLSDTLNDMRGSDNERTLIEVAIIKMSNPSTAPIYNTSANDVASSDTNNSSASNNSLDKNDAIIALLNDKVKQLENKISDINVSGSIPKVEQEEKPKKKVLAKAIPEDVKQLIKNKNKILQNLSGFNRAYMNAANLSVDDNGTLLLVFKDSTIAKKTDENLDEIKAKIQEIINKEINIRVETLKNNDKFEDNYQDIEKLINMEVIET